MVDSYHPNMSVLTAKANQLFTITTQAGNNLINKWFHGLQLDPLQQLVGQCVAMTLRIDSRSHRATGWSVR